MNPKLKLAMNQGYPRLLGDIGGTNARWAWQDAAEEPLVDILVTPCDASDSIYDSAALYLATKRHQLPKWVGIGVATAVNGDVVRLTNSEWVFSIAQLQQSLGAQRCLVINDFTALALSLPLLTSSDLRCVGKGVKLAGAPIALLGPGTGLGVSGLVCGGQGQLLALSGEGGHVTLAALDDHEAELLALLRSRFTHVSAERVLSGQGLADLYRAVCQLAHREAEDLSAVDVTDRAISGVDQMCVTSADMFASFLGNVAGNLVLTLGARGGLYIGGGIVPRLGDAFNARLFRKRFEEKGRFQDYLSAIPSWIITAATPALAGASRALDLMPVN
jgi:glucokinase